MKVISAAFIIVAVTVHSASGAGKASGGSTSAGGTAAVGGFKAAGGTTGVGGVTAKGGAGGYSGVGATSGTGGRAAAGGVTIAAGRTGVGGFGTGGHPGMRLNRSRLGIGIGLIAIPWGWPLAAGLTALALLLAARFTNQVGKPVEKTSAVEEGTAGEQSPIAPAEAAESPEQTPGSLASKTWATAAGKRAAKSRKARKPAA